MKKISIILWGLVFGWLAIAFLLALINIDSALPELMAEQGGAFIVYAIIAQIVIAIYYKFRK